MARQKMSLDDALGHVVRLHEAGQLNQSLQLARQIVAAAPQVALAQNVLSAAAEANGQLDEAVTAARNAIRLAPGMVDAHFNLGTALRKAGKYAEAISALRHAASLAPGDIDVLYNLAVCLQETGQYTPAIEGYRKLLERVPEHADALLGLAMCLLNNGQETEAEQLLNDRVTSRPADQRAWALLLDSKRRSNDVAALENLIERAGKHLGQDDPFVALAVAHVLRESKQLAGAREKLAAVQAPGNAGPEYAIAHAELLGKVLDEAGQHPAAFEQFSLANNISARQFSVRMGEREKYHARLERLSNTFTPQWVETWPAADGEHSSAEPVFLVGFPRSGTTLLDTILRSHSRVCVVEERPAVGATLARAQAMLDDDIADLADLSDEQLTTLQETYLSALNSYREADDRADMVIDKMPLNMLEAGLIHRLFPKAKFLLALRHPCDCVLSCFMQQFRLNATMANFVELERAAHFYDTTFRLWQQYNEAMSLHTHQLRYEDLVTSFDETIAPVLDFLGLEWEDSVRHYIATAKARGRINTPSFNQVTQPLYSSSKGRWQKYRAQLAPALPVLEPWAQEFGYEI